MSAFLWLLWRLLHVTLGGPVQHPASSEEMVPASNSVPIPSSHRLPVFLHASMPLVPPELFRPAPYGGRLPAGLAGLLVPPLRQHKSVPDKVAHAVTHAVEAWCGSENVSVRVDRFLLRAWRVPSLFRIGSCTPSEVTSRFLYFQYGLLECGAQVQVAGGQLVYSYLLNYIPPSQGYVIRVFPINLPIHCYYNRFHYSYKVGYRPQVQHTTFLRSIKSKLTFSLTVCDAQWEPLSPGHTFYLGEQVYFLAEVGTLLAGERLYVDSCQATSSEDPSILPRVDIITNYGCMTDSRREGSSSQFLSGGGSVVKFSVDAFLFRGVSQVQYLHCTMSVGLSTSSIAKSCNFNKATGRWEEMLTSPTVCSCCDSVCTNTDVSVKNHVRSSGWLIDQKLKNTARQRSSEAQEREYLHQKAINKDNVEDSQTFPQDRNGFKDKESVAGRKEWRRMVILEQKKAEEEQTEENARNLKNEDSELTMLLTHMSDEARSHNETAQVGQEGLNLRNSMSSLAIVYKSPDASGTQGNSSFGIEYNPSTQSSSGNSSTSEDTDTTRCPHSNRSSCLAAYSASHKEKPNYNEGHGAISSAVGIEDLSFANVRNSSVNLSEKVIPEVDSVLWSKWVKCVLSTTRHTPVRETVSSNGLNGDADRQVKRLPTGHTHPRLLRHLICNDGESDITTDQTLPQTLLPAKGKLKDSGTRTTLPSFASLSIKSEQTHDLNPKHSAMVTVTTSFQDSNSSPLIDKGWAEVVPEWVVQHLAFLVQKTTLVVQN
ncbi:uncharacterized protein LOC129353764 [Poeciliopsis prolifica]|uniref:uncharacterized protein LOC129353764 n=1 Tax=Poeciliopsis prolifica TaxID=188132 RepID=UPI00241420E0|nr:uncharacterized protein LOC129353764 [Poeciliopsis prolifica]